MDEDITYFDETEGDVIGRWPSDEEIRRRSQSQPRPDWAVDEFGLLGDAR